MSEKTYCLRYETQRKAYADSEGVAELEVIFSDGPNCTIGFLLSGYKGTGFIKSECHDAACPSEIGTLQHVEIRQNSTDAWGIEKLELQEYPGSSNYISYSLDGNRSDFWVDGDNCGYENMCDYGKWCSLKIVNVEGNPVNIIIESSTCFYKIDITNTR